MVYSLEDGMPTESKFKELNTIPQTMEICGGVSRQTIYNLIAANKLRRVKLGRRSFITGASIDALLQSLTEAA